MLNKDGQLRVAASGLIRTAAFTLVELLVVIGIIGVLLAILLPALAGAREQANIIKCMANLKQIGIAMNIYTDNSKGVLPYGYWNGVFDSNTAPAGVIAGYWANFNPDKAGDWTMLLQGVMQTGLTPTYSGFGVNIGQAGFTTPKPTVALAAVSGSRLVFTCPDAPDTALNPYVPISHYGCHPRLMPVWGGQLDYYRTPPSGAPPPFLAPYKIAHIKRSSEVVLVMEGSLAPVNGGGYTVPMGTGSRNTGINGDGHSLDPTTTPIASTSANNTSFSLPVLMELDRARVYLFGANSGGTYLTDDYSAVAAISGEQAASNMYPTGPVDLLPTGANTNLAAACNADTGVNGGNTLNLRNVRFRHSKNLAGNFLMVDGHVETFRWNGALANGGIPAGSNGVNSGNFFRSNINVNP
jgi:prepilin-type processing-associated H-X9-DG protein/prepilin-type N-terminal cleavage/methylation domain-containing protein